MVLCDSHVPGGGLVRDGKLLMDGRLQMPGRRALRSPMDDRRWYHANSPSPTVPEGLGDEAAIRAIWEADAGR